jgi:hypothetical protein
MKNVKQLKANSYQFKTNQMAAKKQENNQTSSKVTISAGLARSKPGAQHRRSGGSLKPSTTARTSLEMGGLFMSGFSVRKD